MRIPVNTVMIMGLSLFLSSCETLNVTSFDTSPKAALEEDESRLWLRSKEEEDRIEEGGFLYDDKVLTEYVNKVLSKVVPEEIRGSGLMPKAKIIKDPRLNAFCYPNGLIYIHTGILARMDNEAQLATLLGHEIGHAIKCHTVKQFRGLKNKTAFMGTFSVTTAGAGGGYGGIIGTLGQVGVIGAFYGYSRELEREADAYGIEKMSAAGYDIREAPKIFKHLKENFDKEKRPDPFFFSSHPKLDERIKSYKDLINTRYIEEAQNESALRNEDKFIGLTKELLLDNADMDIGMGRFETAKVTVEKYLAYEPKSAKAYYYLGRIYEQKFKQPENKKLEEKMIKEWIREKAFGYYKKSISLDNNFAPPYRDMGILYLKQGDKISAKENLVAYLTLSPGADDEAYVQGYLKECSDE